MQRLTHPLARVTLGLGVAAILGLGAAVPAFASGPTSVAISGTPVSGGALTPSNFTPITLDGINAKTATANWSIGNVTDASGTGAGWNVSLSMTRLAQYDATLNAGAGGYTTGGHLLATSSIQATTPATVTLVGSGSAATTVTPVAANTALDTGNAVKLLSAALNGGMGSYSFSALTATLTVPAATYAATYRSDATVSLNSTP